MKLVAASDASVAAFLSIAVVVIVAVVVGTGVAARRTGVRPGPWMTRASLVVGSWVAVTSAVIGSGALDGDPFPGFPLMFGSVLLAGLLFGTSRFGGLLARGIPLWGLVAFQSFRLPLELVLHAWAEGGTIPETMTWTGQNVDIIAGVAAVVAAPLAARRRSAAIIFDVIGIALLANVVRVAVMSAPLPFAWGVTPPLVLIGFLPYGLIGTVLVASAIAGHVVLTRALLARE